MIQKITQLIYKIIARTNSYRRGLFFFMIVNMCGGRCKTIPKVGKGVTFKYPPHKGIIIGKNLDIGQNTILDIPPNATLILGNNIKLTSNIVISSIKKISIGDNCLVAENTSIRDSQHIFFKGIPINKQGLYGSEIIIENDVWIGRNCFIFIGSHLKSGSILGANSTTKYQTLDENCIYTGNPASKIKERKEKFINESK